MNRKPTASTSVLASLLLAGAWYFFIPAPDTAKPTTHMPPPTAHSGSRPALAVASFGSLSPFASMQSEPAPSRLSAPNGGTRQQQLEQFLRDYRSLGASSEEKMQIQKTLRELKQDPLGRTLIIETFFSNQSPELAESLYGLIRDADIKDVALLESLIQRDGATPAAPAKARIIDLIADLSTQEKAPYSAAIDSYLAQEAQNPDPALRNTAASQRIWYLAHHQPNNLAALKNYIVDTAPTVREEMYSLIESRISNQTLYGQSELAEAVNAALRADYLGMSAEEKMRLMALLDSLNGRIASL